MIKKLFFASLFFLLYDSILAQTVNPPILEASENLFHHEQKFRSWLDSNASSAKNWKWMARYEYDLLKRVNSEGELPVNENILHVSSEIEGLKRQSKNARAIIPEWTPAGPYGNASLFGIGRVNCIAFHPKDSLTFYLGFGQGGIWKTTNGGESYLPIGDNLPILRISGITLDPTNPEIMYVSLSDFAYIGYDLYTADRKRNTYYGIGVWKSVDGGKNWKQTGLKNKLDEGINSITRTIWVNPNNPKEVVVVGTKGIFKSFDAGDSWSLKVLDKMCSALVQHPTSANILFASAVKVGTINVGEGGLWKSIDAGNTWKLLQTGMLSSQIQRIEVAISRSNPNVMYAVTCNNSNGFEGFYVSQNTGEAWTKSPFKGNLLNTSYSATGGQGFYDLCILVHPEKPQTVYVGGLILNETTDGGTTWKQATSYSNIHPDQHALDYNPINKTIYVCNDGGVYSTKKIIASTQQNLSWTFISKGINATSCYRIGLSTNGEDIITGAQDNNSFLSIGKKSWTSEFSGDGMECAIFDNYIYGSSQYGSIYFIDPLNRKRKFGSIFPPNSGSDVGEWTTPFVINKASKEVIIGGGNIHKVLLGEVSNTLKTISSFNPIGNTRFPEVASALAVPQSNANTIYVAKRNSPLNKRSAQLLKTIDNGATWQDITTNIYKESYVTYLTVDDQNPERVWATLSNFVIGEKVYFSENGGQSWKNISYNLPNLPANCIVYQASDFKVLYVAMDIGVFYLKEGSTTWKPLMGNLPNVIVHELEINQATKKLFAATFGRGIWSIDLLNEDLVLSKEFYSMKINLFPNPNTGSFTLKSDFDNIEKIQVIDILGRTLLDQKLNPKDLFYEKEFKLLNKRKGLYFVNLISGNLSKTIKMVVD